MNRSLPVVVALTAWLAVSSCGSVPESRLPVMGLGDRASAARSDTVAARVAHGVTAAVPADSDSALTQSILLLPFRDLTKYRGSWDPGVSLPRALADTLAHRSFLRLLPIDSVLARLSKKERKGEVSIERALAMGHDLAADYVLFGEIADLSMQRFRATVPIGGYRSYQGVTNATVRLVRVIDGQPAGEVTREATEDTKRYGITNPASYVPYEKEYYQLGQMEWGSEAFRQTLVGKSVASCLSGLAAGVDSLIRPSPGLATSEPRVIDVEGSRAYINVGLADSIANGQKFGVWDRGRELTDPRTGVVLGQSLPRRVGVIQVEQVLSEHLSMVRVLEGEEAILPDYAIRAE